MERDHDNLKHLPLRAIGSAPGTVVHRGLLLQVVEIAIAPVYVFKTTAFPYYGLEISVRVSSGALDIIAVLESNSIRLC